MSCAKYLWFFYLGVAVLEGAFLRLGRFVGRGVEPQVHSGTLSNICPISGSQSWKWSEAWLQNYSQKICYHHLRSP